MGRKRKILDPSKAWKRADLAITQRLQEPIVGVPDLTVEQVEEVSSALMAACFSDEGAQVKSQILAALANTIEYQKTPYKPYVFKKLRRDTLGCARSKGPHQKEAARFLLIGTLFWAWRHEFGQEPKINRKIVQYDWQTRTTPFVAFATSILAVAKIYKVIDNLNAYLAHERTLQGQSPK
jgi:hypothetical protein